MEMKDEIFQDMMKKKIMLRINVGCFHMWNQQCSFMVEQNHSAAQGTQDVKRYIGDGEIYHGLQYDIALEPPAIDSWCDEDATKKSGWFVEGAADYFANHVYGEYIGEDGVNRILRRAMTAYAETGPGLNDGGIAVTAASALRLLVERGALKHSDIIDGTLFHKCERVSVYHDNNPDVKIAKSSWSEIQYVYGKYSFKPSVLY